MSLLAWLLGMELIYLVLLGCLITLAGVGIVYGIRWLLRRKAPT